MSSEPRNQLARYPPRFTALQTVGPLGDCFVAMWSRPRSLTEPDLGVNRRCGRPPHWALAMRRRSLDRPTAHTTPFRDDPQARRKTSPQSARMRPSRLAPPSIERTATCVLVRSARAPTLEPSMAVGVAQEFGASRLSVESTRAMSPRTWSMSNKRTSISRASGSAIAVDGHGQASAVPSM